MRCNKINFLISMEKSENGYNQKKKRARNQCALFALNQKRLILYSTRIALDDFRTGTALQHLKKPTLSHHQQVAVLQQMMKKQSTNMYTISTIAQVY